MIEKQYTDYSYVTAYALRRILNLSNEGVSFLLKNGNVLGTVISKRTKYILGHVRRAQDALAIKQNAHVMAQQRSTKTVDTMEYYKYR